LAPASNSTTVKLDCLIRNASRSGVKVIISDSITLPQETHLHVHKTRQRLPIRLAWRSAGACGFELTNPPGNIISLPSTPIGNLFRLWDDKTGGVLIEYALLAGIGMIVAVREAQTIGPKLSAVFGTLSNALR
jgi:Flp pilus assembly pilin Flp